MTLSLTYINLLKELSEAGSATLDLQRRLVHGPLKSFVGGDTGTWLWLIAHGYVKGNDGQLSLTEAGKTVVTEYEQRLSSCAGVA